MKIDRDSLPLAERVIKFWVIVYYGDIRQSYVITDFNKVVASVESSIRGYFEENDVCDSVCKNIIRRLRSLENAMIIPIKVDDLQIIVHRWEMDHMTKVHQVLTKCHEAVPDDLREEIEELLVPTGCII